MLKKKEKISLYGILRRSLTPGQTYPMAKVSKLMSDAGYGCKAHGYSKMKTMLSEIPEYFILSEPEQSGRDMRVTLQFWETAEPVDTEKPSQDTKKTKTPKKTTEKSTVLLDDAKKEEIYRIIVSKIAFDEPKNLSGIANLLMDENILPSTFGFPKMKDFLAAMPEFVTLTSKTPTQLEVTFRRWERDTEFPPTLQEFAFLPPNVLTLFSELKNGKGVLRNELPFLEKMYRKGIRDKEYQKEKDPKGNDSIRFFTGVYTEKKDAIYACFTPNAKKDLPQKWALTYVGSVAAPAPVNTAVQTSPKSALGSFASLGNWYGFLDKLAGMALEERWDFSDEEPKQYYILRKYIEYTFFKVLRETEHEDEKEKAGGVREPGRGIVFSENGDYAAVNTGLVDQLFRDIIMLFTKSSSGKPKWELKDFCVAGETGSGKLLTDHFLFMPKRARYYTKLEELLFDPEREIFPSTHHILLDNMSRLPTAFLRRYCLGDQKALSYISRIEKAENTAARSNAIDKLRTYVEANPALYRSFSQRLDAALDTAKKWVQWNYKNAIPCYFPKEDRMSLMLPLCLADDTRADTALVVDLTAAGYRGQTILTLSQAYLDARLLFRPNSEWLQRTEEISFFGADAKEEELEN